jgi:putative ABC transport system permease protein
MLRNHLIIAIRTLQRNVVYSAINIIGLAVGLASSALILLWVADELSFDTFHENHERIHLVGSNQVINGNIETTFDTPYPLMDALRQRSSQITQVALVKTAEGYLMSHGDNRISKMGVVTAGDFLTMFSFRILSGDPRTALRDATSAVLTRSTAMALFGTTDAVGKTFTLETAHELAVSAVIEDVPANSSLQFDFLLPSGFYESTQEWYKRSMTNWQNHSFKIFAELRPGADAQEVSKQIASLEKENNASAPSAENFLHPLAQWHLHGEFENGKISGGMIEYVRLFAIIAIFVLVIACINFTNLATARSQSRAREVGIRKTIGSQRKQLIFQFIGESLIITSIAFLFAVVIIELALPFYNMVVGKNLFLQYSDPALYVAAGIIIIITALLAGAYPAFYLSSFQPVSVLKGGLKGPATSGTSRKILVTLQFGFSIFLVIGSIVIYQQIMHVKSRHVGYNKENLMLIWTNTQREQNYATIKQQLLSSGVVESVTKSSAPITRIFSSTDGVSWPGKAGEDKVSFVTMATEYDFAKTMGIKLLEGRDFSPEVGTDTSAIIINKSALDLMGLDDPIGQKIRIWGDDRTIVGVTEDIVMGSPYHPVGPMAMVLIPAWSSTISVRLNASQDIPQAVATVEKIFKAIDPEHPLWHRFADEEFQVKFQSLSLVGRLALGFTVLAIFISSLGLFGLAAFTAEQRTKEVGIRKILGASVANVLLLITKDFSRLVIAAFVITAPIAWWMIDLFLQQYPYRITPHWWVLVVTGASVLVLTIIIVSTQALKAAMSNPVRSLRSE